MKGGRHFYQNVDQQDDPTDRFAWHPVPCCPPNIVKLFAKVGGIFYSTDGQGIFVKHYSASEARIPFGGGVKLVQRTEFPWDGKITLQVWLNRPMSFASRLRLPAWAKSHELSVNRTAVDAVVAERLVDGAARLEEWGSGRVFLPMEIERVRMPPGFKEYANLAALQRGPIVYCLEEQDMAPEMGCPSRFSYAAICFPCRSCANSRTRSTMAYG